VIGSLTDAAQPPILYSVRLICHTFLLTGNTEERLYADRDVRVSIKSLALSCLLYILKFYPQAIEHQLYTSAHCGEILSSGSLFICNAASKEKYYCQLLLSEADFCGVEISQVAR